jgi:hypothetical protein
MRWAVALVVPAAIGVSLIMAAFETLITWHSKPLGGPCLRRGPLLAIDGSAGQADPCRFFAVADVDTVSGSG